MSDQFSTSWRRAGTRRRISSARVRERSRAFSFVLDRQPVSVSGVRGGGWKGEAVRRGAWKSPLLPSWRELSTEELRDVSLEEEKESVFSRRRMPETA